MKCDLRKTQTHKNAKWNDSDTCPSTNHSKSTLNSITGQRHANRLRPLTWTPAADLFCLWTGAAFKQHSLVQCECERDTCCLQLCVLSWPTGKLWANWTPYEPPMGNRRNVLVQMCQLFTSGRQHPHHHHHCCYSNLMKRSQEKSLNLLCVFQSLASPTCPQPCHFK